MQLQKQAMIDLYSIIKMNNSLIENKIDVAVLDKYAAIIGEKPSNGARSPELWNKVFKESDLNYKMVPIDVSENKLKNLLNSLNNDERFLGGAIAVPYKELVADWLGKNISEEAKEIGAVNCLFRNPENQLFGTNTDGEASLKSFNDNFGSINDKNIMILGAGGAGKAVAAYFAKSAKSTILVSRSLSGKNYSKKIGAIWKSWEDINDYLFNVDVLLNCTSIGFQSQESKSPLNQDQISSLSQSSIIFDIIYQPLETRLLLMAKNNNIQTLNGLKMNLEQAVLAYKYAINTNLTLDQVYKIMSKV